MAVVLPAFIRPRSSQNTVVRAVRYLGLAAWVGGGLARAVATGRSAEDGGGKAGGWERVARVAIAAHLWGSAALGWAGRHRGLAQQGMPTAMLLDTAATAFALTARTVTRRRGTSPSFAEPLLAAGSIAAQGYLAEQQRPLASAHRFRLLPTRGRPPGRRAVARAASDAGLSVAFGVALHRLITASSPGRTGRSRWGRWTTAAVVAASGLALVRSATGAESNRPVARARQLLRR